VGDGVGVPAFGEHGDGYHAADGIAQAADLADGVHDLAQQRSIVQLFTGPKLIGEFAAALKNLAAKLRDLGACHDAEIFVQRLAGFELFTVDQQSARPAQGIAVLVMVAKQG